MFEKIGLSSARTVKSFLSLISRLLWMSRCTQPEMSFLRFTDRWHTHRLFWWTMKWQSVLRSTFQGTKSLKICLEHDDEMSTPLRTIRYNDADFAADKDDRKGISADIIYVISIIAGWNCKKQGTVALSAALLQFEDERHWAWKYCLRKLVCSKKCQSYWKMTTKPQWNAGKGSKCNKLKTWDVKLKR